MTAFFRKKKVGLWRLLFGSFIGTTYLLIIFIEALSPLYSWYGKVMLSTLIILSTFGIKRFNLFFKDLLVFYMVSFLFGGGLFALQFFFQGNETTLNGFVIEADAYLIPQTSMITLILGYLLMFYLSKIYYQVIEVGKRRTAYICTYTIKLMGKTIEGKGLIDTGNQLHEPITRIPVIILQVDQLHSILPKQLSEVVHKGDQAITDSSLLAKIPIEWQSRIRFIPYRGVGKGNQMLIALLPDQIELQDDHRIYRIHRVRIGLTTEKVSADGEFVAILHPELLNDKYSQSQSEEAQYANTISP